MADTQNLILDKLNWRYAVKKFDPSKKISPADWNVLEETLRLTPSSYGLQPWQFWVIEDNELRQKLREASWNQSQVTDCSHFVVFLYKKILSDSYIQKHIDSMVSIRGVTSESLDRYKAGIYKDLMTGARSKEIPHWAQKQGYIAMGMLMYSAALLGIDTCPMEGLDPAKYSKILDLEKTEWAVAVAVACGYRHAEDRYQHNQKVRFPPSEVIKRFPPQ